MNDLAGIFVFSGSFALLGILIGAPKACSSFQLWWRSATDVVKSELSDPMHIHNHVTDATIRTVKDWALDRTIADSEPTTPNPVQRTFRQRVGRKWKMKKKQDRAPAAPTHETEVQMHEEGMQDVAPCFHERFLLPMASNRPRPVTTHFPSPPHHDLSTQVPLNILTV